MKTKITYSLLAAAAACGFAQAQTTAYTTPVGYVSLGDTTPGQPAIKANTDVFVSIPLQLSSVFAGTVSSVSGNTITISGTPALGSLTTIPHTITIGSGTKAGLIATVLTNTSDSVTVAVASGDSLTGIAAADKIVIRRAWTVGGFMGSTFPSGTQLLTLPDSSAFNPSAVGIYEWDGTGWVDTVNTGDYADNDVLYPNETLIVRNQSATPITSFVVSGEVPTASNRVVIAANGAGGADNAISYFGPVDEAIGLSGLSAIANSGDQILGFNNNSPGINKSATAILEYDGTGWVDTVNTGDYDPNFPLGSGQGFLFRRATASGAAIWSDTATYIPSL
jgi:uncharacterized protein (TIGR02597 family)